MVRLLLDNQANPNTSHAKKETALIVAASAGDLQSVKMLLEHRGDLEVQRKSLQISDWFTLLRRGILMLQNCF